MAKGFTVDDVENFAREQLKEIEQRKQRQRVVAKNALVTRRTVPKRLLDAARQIKAR